jgi:hypothetical protein
LDDETVTENEEPKRQAHQSIVKDEIEADEAEGSQYELEDGEVIPLDAPNKSTSATSKRIEKVHRSMRCILLL